MPYVCYDWYQFIVEGQRARSPGSIRPQHEIWLSWLCVVCWKMLTLHAVHLYHSITRLYHILPSSQLTDIICIVMNVQINNFWELQAAMLMTLLWLITTKSTAYINCHEKKCEECAWFGYIFRVNLSLLSIKKLKYIYTYLWCYFIVDNGKRIYAQKFHIAL